MHPQASAPLEVRPVVLLVEDKPTMADWVLQVMRTDSDVRFHHHSDTAGAVERALEVEPTVILQELMMRGAYVYDLIRRYRAAPALAKVPVLALAGRYDVESSLRAFEAGASDYVVKTPQLSDLMPRIRTHSTSYALLREREQLIQGLQHTTKQLNESRAELARVATDDAPTGLANARALEELLAREWKRAARDAQPLSLALIEIDFFRAYEQRYGASLTEQCLLKLAEVMRAHARRPADLAARSGGDRFALLLPQTPAQGARLVACQVQQAIAGLSLPHGAREDAHRIVTVSLGVATVLPAPNTAMHLFREAEQALEWARQRGRDVVVHATLDAEA
jgi:two-component system chemotaxis family response regulator WspR